LGLLLFAVPVGGGGITWLAADGGAALLSATVIATTGVAILTIAGVVRRGRGRLGAIGLQFALAAGGATLAGGSGAWLAAVLPDEAHRELVLATVLVSVAVLVARVAYVVGMAVGDDVDRIGDGLMAVGEGDRTIRLPTVGSDQVSRLAEAGNRMTDQLVLREAERDEAQTTRHELVRAVVDQLREREAERDAAEEQRRQLFVGVSHDLRTPLTSLALLATALRDEAAPPQDRARYAEQMLAQIASLTQLTEQLFELSRLEAGDVSGPRVRMSIGDLVLEAADQMRTGAAARAIELEVDLPTALPAVEIEPDRVARVLVNLLQNALMHTPAEGRVRVGVSATRAVVEVAVADTGDGVAPADRERIFEPFFRGGAGSSRTGTGLGLAICRAIVEAHGGRIWLADSERGATFAFALPRVEDATAVTPPA
jgi:signal transduction histidine kinase